MVIQVGGKTARAATIAITGQVAACIPPSLGELPDRDEIDPGSALTKRNLRGTTPGGRGHQRDADRHYPDGSRREAEDERK